MGWNNDAVIEFIKSVPDAKLEHFPGTSNYITRKEVFTTQLDWGVVWPAHPWHRGRSLLEGGMEIGVESGAARHGTAGRWEERSMRSKAAGRAWSWSLHSMVGWRRIFLLVVYEGFSPRSWLGDRAHLIVEGNWLLLFYCLLFFSFSQTYIPSYLDTKLYLYRLLFSCFLPRVH